GNALARHSVMTGEAAKAPTGLPCECDTSPVQHQGADLTAGQRAQVKVFGQRTDESALDSSPPANRPAAVSPMGKGRRTRTRARVGRCPARKRSCAARSDT